MLTSGAFVESDPARIVAIGLSVIPTNCRLAEAVRDDLTWIRKSSGFESFMEKMDGDTEVAISKAGFCSLAFVH